MRRLGAGLMELLQEITGFCGDATFKLGCLHPSGMNLVSWHLRLYLGRQRKQLMDSWYELLPDGCKDSRRRKCDIVPLSSGPCAIQYLSEDVGTKGGL